MCGSHTVTTRVFITTMLILYSLAVLSLQSVPVHSQVFLEQPGPDPVLMAPVGTQVQLNCSVVERFRIAWTIRSPSSEDTFVPPEQSGVLTALPERGITVERPTDTISFLVINATETNNNTVAICIAVDREILGFAIDSEAVQIILTDVTSAPPTLSPETPSITSQTDTDMPIVIPPSIATPSSDTPTNMPSTAIPSSDTPTAVTPQAITSLTDTPPLQVIFHPVYFAIPEQFLPVNGSSATGRCENVTEGELGPFLCLEPTTSVLFDGSVPTLTGLDGDMWASQLLTLPALIRPIRELVFDFTDTADYAGVVRVEVVMFNCPDWGIGVSTVSTSAGPSPFETTAVATVTPTLTSCDHLVRVCVPVLTLQPVIKLGLALNGTWIHLAEITFYADTLAFCLADAIVTTPPALTTISTAMPLTPQVATSFSDTPTVTSQTATPPLDAPTDMSSSPAIATPSSSDAPTAVTPQSITSFTDTPPLQVIFHPVYFAIPEQFIPVNGSSATGKCENVTEGELGPFLCLEPTTSVLFDGSVPTLTGLDGDMWASQLLTLPALIRPIRELVFDFTDTANYAGVVRVEVVMFNCPDWGIGVSTVSTSAGPSPFETTAVATVTPTLTSCDHLVRVCVPILTLQPVIKLGLVLNGTWIHLAEITFYADTLAFCLADAIVTTPPALTTISTAMPLTPQVATSFSDTPTVTSQTATPPLDTPTMTSQTAAPSTAPTKSCDFYIEHD